MTPYTDITPELLNKEDRFIIQQLERRLSKYNNNESYLLGMNHMFEWIESLPIDGSAGRLLNLHLSPIRDWIEKVNIKIKK